MALLGWILIALALLGSHLIAHAAGAAGERGRCLRIVRRYAGLVGWQVEALVTQIDNRFDEDDDDHHDDGGEPCARTA